MSKYHNQVIIVILKSFNSNYYNKHDQLFRYLTLIILQFIHIDLVKWKTWSFTNINQI